ncbi:DoxX family protein [Mucilaginibacter rubeus]|uniref:DoxX family protein n=1 Tax=Mucilaginibacter rubeus TaxID=2027860 RepID=A0AAE6JN85_9SPHI|nr:MULTISPECIES: DoxX family protein [Mucilaginibacter]QEM07710.1 DoxX family protein [Mucilaginibacter rubeus]QEM20162.1 DoxX family protein [Mucilaginibacter gossypii]QTE43124.1 DoxX family protein [Mucilaginibacter rubeus]QTE49724.1 DoxX family protein [Mucilaginibacter rubeus]QTE54817.1 DoxX family protein [Mucilaginibacter rubeus]
MTYTQFNILVWALRLVAAIIMLQTLFFKFTAAPESVYIFAKLGMEPWGRIGLGSMELVAAILIIIPRTTGIGALIAVGLMAGAIFFHLTKLGIVVQGDGGQLFILATIVFATSAILLYIFRKEVLNLIPLLH